MTGQNPGRSAPLPAGKVKFSMNEAPSGDLGPAHSRTAFWGVIFAAIICLGAAAFVQFPYLAARHSFDDMYLLLEAGLVRTGRAGWLDYLLRPYSGHQVFGWKLLYQLELECFGLEPAAWHIVTLTAHAASGFALFHWLRRYGVDGLAALAAAAIWSGAAIGRWDNPLQWPAAGCIVLATLLLQLAQLAAGPPNQSERPVGSPIRRGRSAGPILVTVLTGAAILAWGIMWILTLVVPAQLLLLDRARSSGRADWRRVLSAWLVPFVVLGYLELSAYLPQLGGALSTSEAGGLGQVPYRGTMQLATSLGQLVHWDVETAGTEAIGAKLTVMVLAGVLVVGVGWKEWRLLAVIWVVPIVYLVGVNLSRRDIPLEAALSWGRYAYLPTLAWCATLGVVLSGIGCAMPTGKGVRFVVCLAVVAASLIHQRSIAQFSATQYAWISRDQVERFQATRALLERLNDLAARARIEVTIPEIPVDVPPVEGVIFPLSAFVAVAFPDGLAHLQIANTTATEEDQLRSISLLRSEGSELAKRWAQSIEQVYPLQRAVGWLSETVVANAPKDGTAVRLPNLLLRVGGRDLELEQLMAASFGTATLPGLAIIPHAGWTSNDAAALERLLEAQPGKWSAYWRRFLEQAQGNQRGR